MRQPVRHADGLQKQTAMSDDASAACRALAQLRSIHQFGALLAHLRVLHVRVGDHDILRVRLGALREEQIQFMANETGQQPRAIARQVRASP